jgi:phospholipid/cholesterol/gamma-HCH transport system substrate-binding protein
MNPRTRLVAALAVAFVVLGAASTAVVTGLVHPKSIKITALFKSATSVYPGDDVRVLGVKVGTITAIEPAGTRIRMSLSVNRSEPIPADARAVIVSQSLLAARYVQLTPAYTDRGPTMSDGAVVPIERTAVPVEWDEIKSQLARLATDLGPRSGVSGTSMGRFIDSAADALQGNGAKFRQTLSQLSSIGRILADGTGNIVDVIQNLQTFVTALRDSKVQIVQFEDRLATLSSVLNDGTSNLDAALKGLSSAVGDVRRFVAGTRNQTSEQIQRLAAVTQNLVDHQKDLEQVLHAAPNGLSNYYNMYNPTSGTDWGSFVLTNFANPLQMICASIGGIENKTAPETDKLCAEYLGPALRLLNANHIPLPFNPYLGPAPRPEDLVYSDPSLAPGGAGAPPRPPEAPPSVSAYSGLPQDVAAPSDLPSLLLPPDRPAP